jgi:hypothetical protein
MHSFKISLESSSLFVWIIKPSNILKNYSKIFNSIIPWESATNKYSYS